MSDDTMLAPLAQYSSRDFAEGRRTIWAFTREKAIELEGLEADMVNARSSWKIQFHGNRLPCLAYPGRR